MKHLIIIATLLLSSCIGPVPGFRQVDAVPYVNDGAKGAVVLDLRAIGPFAEPDATD